MSETAIETVGLTKKFGDFVALDSLSLKVEHKHSIGFLGPNGAGKTTAIKILTYLISPTSGEAFINGVSILDNQKKALSQVGVIVETPEFYPYLTPNETLEYLGRLRGLSSATIKENSKRYLELTKMDEWADKKIGKFSKGMKQRIALAQALLHEPTLLILDEPTSGLDPRGMAEVRDVIRNVIKEGYTVFMASHLLNEVQEVCDRVAMIDRGRLLIHESIENLFKNARIERIDVTCLNEITEQLMAKIQQIHGVSALEHTLKNAFSLSFSGDESTRAKLLTDLQAAGVIITSFKPSGRILENVYMELIKDSR